MKSFAKFISLALALLMLAACFAACGDKPEETTKKSEETEAPANTDPRQQTKDTVPSDLNYQNETITFFVRDDQEIYKYEISCEELLNDTLFDAIHYRNIDVEGRLGVKIRSIGQSGTYDDRKAWNETLSTSVLTNSSDYDATTFYISQGSPLAKDGIFYNMMGLDSNSGDGYFNFSKPWWNQTVVDELTVYGTLFFIGGDVTITEISKIFAINFNKDLFEAKFPEERVDTLYQLVRDGEWTVEKMTSYVSEVWDDTNSSGIVDDGDVVGMYSQATDRGAGGMDGWVYAMGLDVTKKNDYGEPEISLVYDPNLVPAYEAVRKLHNRNPGVLLAKGANVSETKFENGNVLFGDCLLEGGASLRESNVTYGVLPLPKYNVEQEDYRTTFGNTASALALCSNLSDERAIMLSAVLELLCAESYKQVVPAYYSIVLQGHYAKDQADAEMYDKILSTSVFTFGYAYATASMSDIGSVFRDMTDSYDIQATIDSNKALWEQNLTDLLTALEAVS
jgi:hypothetical protein